MRNYGEIGQNGEKFELRKYKWRQTIHETHDWKLEITHYVSKLNSFGIEIINRKLIDLSVEQDNHSFQTLPCKHQIFFNQIVQDALRSFNYPNEINNRMKTELFNLILLHSYFIY